MCVLICLSQMAIACYCSADEAVPRRGFIHYESLCGLKPNGKAIDPRESAGSFQRYANLITSHVN